jgi:hypothetical protein
MFSMKPKFNLPEFLAEPARPGAHAKARQFNRPPPPPKPGDKRDVPETKE